LSKPPLWGFLLTTPALVLVTALAIFPLGYAVYISLTNYPLVGPYHFIGITNYSLLVHNPAFLHSLLLTVIYTAIVTGPVFVGGYGLAMLTRSNRRGATVLRTCFFLPYIVGLTVESFVLWVELQPKSGTVNYALKELGLTNGNTAWLIHTNLAMVAICSLVVWFGAGFTMVLLLAGMQSIPRDLYESAAIDGASWWGRERRITVPLLRPSIALSLILSVIGSFLAFNQFEILTQGGPGTSTAPIVLWIYQTAFDQDQLGLATAAGIVLVVVVGLISIVQFRVLRTDSER
jgi:multiple sugar transport system permease protein